MTAPKIDITDAGIENYFKNKDNAGPRVKLSDIESEIKSIEYFTALDGLRATMGENWVPPIGHKLDMMLFCIITMNNGFVFTGENSCVDRSNYNRAMSEQMSKQQAMNKAWPIFGYMLTDKLHKEKTA